MQLTAALDIAQKATNLLAQNTGAKPHVYRYSDVGAASLKTILDAMQLDMASQYQLHISTRRRTAAQFKELANMYGGLGPNIIKNHLDVERVGAACAPLATGPVSAEAPKSQGGAENLLEQCSDRTLLDKGYRIGNGAVTLEMVGDVNFATFHRV